MPARRRPGARFRRSRAPVGPTSSRARAPGPARRAFGAAGRGCAPARSRPRPPRPQSQSPAAKPRCRARADPRRRRRRASGASGRPRRPGCIRSSVCGRARVREAGGVGTPAPVRPGLLVVQERLVPLDLLRCRDAPVGELEPYLGPLVGTCRSSSTSPVRRCGEGLRTATAPRGTRSRNALDGFLSPARRRSAAPPRSGRAPAPRPRRPSSRRSSRAPSSRRCGSRPGRGAARARCPTREACNGSA